MARALERVGERWGLLIVRDLLSGDRRFTDLAESCAGITRRQLTARLRQLEQAGVVERLNEGGRREVRYRLTTAGRDLQPVVEALRLWGIRYAHRQPLSGELVLGRHILDGTRQVLDKNWPPGTGPKRVTWRFPKEAFTLRFVGGRWQLAEGEDPLANLVIETTPRVWAQFLMSAAAGHPRAPRFELHGSEGDQARLLAAFGAKRS